MRRFIVPVAIAMTCGMLFLPACNQFSDIDEIQDVEFEASYAVPIINSVSTLADLLDSSDEDLSQLTSDANGNYTFFYEDEGPEKSSEEIFEQIPDFPFVLPDTYVSVPVNFYNNIELQEMIIKSGEIQFEFVSQHLEDIQVEIRFPQLKRDGAMFRYNFDLNYNGNAPVQASTDPVSIAGYTMEFTNGEIVMEYTAKKLDGESVSLNLVGGLATNWRYAYLQGVWTKEEFGLEKDTLDIDVFEEKFDGEVSFADPKLMVTLENSFGFPVMAKINTLQMIDEFGQVLELESTLFAQGLHLDYPSMGQTNQSRTTTITFDRTNSNIVELLNSQPQQIIYDFAVVINSEEDTSTPGFITDDSKVKVSIRTEVPVYGTLANLSVENVVDNDLNDTEEVESIELKLITDNGLPLNLDLQFHFLDQDQNVIGSLFESDIHPLNAASVDGDGNVSQSSRMVTTIPISPTQMTMLKASQKLMMVAGISTSNDGTAPVRMNRNQNLEVQLGAIVKVKK